jgi:transcriptional regulator with XRE-family HTH domain
MTKKAINPKKFPQLPDKLKQARNQKGLTQGQLAQKTGVDVQRLSKYERSVLVPTTEVIVKISEALGVSLDYLLKNGKNTVVGQIQDSELLKRTIQVDTLPDKERHILKEILEAFIKKHRFEEVAAK